MSDFFIGCIFGIFITVEFWQLSAKPMNREFLEKFKMKAKKWMHQQP